MHAVIRKLNIFAPLSREEETALTLALGQTFEVSAREELAREEDPPTNVFFLLEGFAYRHKMLPSGQRQLLAFMLPGDSCDLGITVLERRDHSISTAVRSKVARVSDAVLDHLCLQYPKIRAALRWASLAEESTSREWLLNIGQRRADEAAAHIMCELYYRLRTLGLAPGLNYEFPLSQQELGEALGLTAVHVNRTLQNLRHQKLIALGEPCHRNSRGPVRIGH